MRGWTTWAAVLLGAMLMAAPAAYAGPASDFTLRNVDGQPTTLSSLKGKVVVLSFWATWCGPCKEEMPHLDKMYKELKDRGLVVLSISADDARTASQVKPFIMRSGYTFPVLLDKDSAVITTYNAQKTLPFTVVIDKQQQVAHVHSGFNPGDEAQLRAKVLELLAK